MFPYTADYTKYFTTRIVYAAEAEVVEVAGAVAFSTNVAGVVAAAFCGASHGGGGQSFL